jgi:hypothetical protein
MTRTWLVAVLAALVLIPDPSPAQDYRIYGAERFFQVEWEAGMRAGHPVVSGYLENTFGIVAIRLRLLVESLDQSGQVIERTIDWVPGDVTPGSRYYFEVAVPRAAPAYRVIVLSWDWKHGHGS